MQKAGYLASLEQQTEWLKTCDYKITYLNEHDEECTTYTPKKNLEWHLENYYPSKNFQILAVSKLEKEKVDELAKAITDTMAKRLYNYVHQD